MAINREFWKNLHFSDDSTPHLVCPRCGRGALGLDKKSLHHALQGDSRKDMAEHGSCAELYAGNFICLFVCTQFSCQEPVAVLGDVEEYTDYDQRKDIHIFHPKFFLPALNIFPLDEKCPKEISGQLRLAFGLFFCNPAGAMSHVRKAVEALCSRLGIGPRRLINRKVVNVALHTRIERLRTEKNLGALADRLLALKWLGNEGSHDGNISKDDVLDAFELFEDVIDRQYGHRQKTLALIERQINQRKKPRSRRS
jgi:hypothetical protein